MTYFLVNTDISIPLGSVHKNLLGGGADELYFTLLDLKKILGPILALNNLRDSFKVT